MGQFVREKIIAKLQENQDRELFVDGGMVTTRGQFLERSGRLASKLRSKGVTPGSFVVVELPKNVDAVCSFVACWMVGAGCAPASLMYPAERLRYIEENCEAAAVVDADFVADLEDFEPLDLATMPELHDEDPGTDDLYFRIHRQSQGCTAHTAWHVHDCGAGFEVYGEKA